MNDADTFSIGSIFGFVVTFAVFTVLVIGGAFDKHPERECPEDAVYTWVGDFPDHVVYYCIPLDDLNTLRGG